MKILGIRNYSEGIRYCILEKNISNKIVCTNLNGENLIKIPKEYATCEDMLVWYKNEIIRILDTCSEIKQISLKHNENVISGCYANLKKVMFMDCIVTLIAKERNIGFNSFEYKQIGVNSKNVQIVAENNFGKTDKKWDKNIADALMAAYKIFENGDQIINR